MKVAQLRSAVLLAVVAGAAALPGSALGAPQKISWSKCAGEFQCGTLQVPLDYRKPDGPEISLALTRLRATDPGRRIGSLLLNPGGPGGSGVMFLHDLGPILFTEEVRARYDLVGFDPRGIAGSSALRCFGTQRQWGPYFLPMAFPTNAEEEAQWEEADRFVTDACEQRGGKIASHMSTANVARDLESMRRALGDARLNYYGISYGSYLGTTYANMFPSKVGRLAVDAVLDPVAWSTGEPGEENLPFSTRLNSATGAHATLEEFFRLCDGGVGCAFGPDSEARYNALAERLRTSPVTVTFPDGYQEQFNYSQLVGVTLGAMYNTFAWPELAWLLAEIERGAGGTATGARVQALRLKASFLPKRGKLTYYNGLEGFPAVACADSDGPSGYDGWRGAASLASDQQSELFGPLWTWITSICAPWQFGDSGRYMGPFDKTTANPVLVIGNLYDPATPYHGAQKLAGMLPNSALLTLAGWGHASILYSSCIDAAVETFLVSGRTPPAGTVCSPDYVPFAAQE